MADTFVVFLIFAQHMPMRLICFCVAITAILALQPQPFHRTLLNKNTVNKTAYQAWDTANDAAHAARNGIKILAQTTETLQKATKQT